VESHADLMIPNTASGVCLRNAQAFLPGGVENRQAMDSIGVVLKGKGGALASGKKKPCLAVYLVEVAHHGLSIK